VFFWCISRILSNLQAFLREGVFLQLFFHAILLKIERKVENHRCHSTISILGFILFYKVHRHLFLQVLCGRPPWLSRWSLRWFLRGCTYSGGGLVGWWLVGWSVGRFVVGGDFFRSTLCFRVCGLTFRVKASKSLMRQNSHRIHLHDKKNDLSARCHIVIGLSLSSCKRDPYSYFVAKIFQLA